jgi:hypothetical protein
MRQDSPQQSRGAALLPACRLYPRVPAPPLRVLLAEAAEYRRRGDLAAAHVAELAALIALRAIAAETRQGVAR